MMKRTLFLVMLLFSFSVHAEKIRVFDDVCVAEQIKNCIKTKSGCDSGTEIHVSIAGGSGAALGCFTPTQGQQHGLLQNIILACQVLGRSTQAIAANCSREIDIPSAAQIEALTKALNDNFIKALEKAFPQPATPSQPIAPSVQTQ